MNNPFGTQDRDRNPERDRLTQQGQDGQREGSYERNSPYAQGQGRHAQDLGGDRGQPENSRYAEFNRVAGGADEGQIQGQGQGQHNAGASHLDPQPPSSYGQGSAHGVGTGEGRQDPNHDFDPDYLQWREQRMSQYDRDYRDWRTETRQSFSSDFEGWRTSRGNGSQTQAQNPIVGDVSDGGVGSQAGADPSHEDPTRTH